GGEGGDRGRHEGVVLDQLVFLQPALEALARHCGDPECHARPAGFTKSARGGEPSQRCAAFTAANPAAQEIKPCSPRSSPPRSRSSRMPRRPPAPTRPL